jgi:hypothetical protein
MKTTKISAQKSPTLTDVLAELSRNFTPKKVLVAVKQQLMIVVLERPKSRH